MSAEDLLGLPSRRAKRPVVLVQFSDVCLTSDLETQNYYRRSYRRMDGYRLPPHFMEIPYWIPIVASMLPDSAYTKELMVVVDVNAAVAALSARDDNPIVFMSVMDASLAQSARIAAVGLETIVGSYTEPGQFRGLTNVTYLADVGDLARRLPHTLDAPLALDYRLFDGLECIPRLSLSSGCAFRCQFCTVPTELVPVSEAQVMVEVDALRPLDFELIFLDDKSFGQASNWRSLASARDRVCEHSPDFLGFIAQTPPSIAARPGFLAECLDLGVRYIEFGVEIVDDASLRWLRKPFTTSHLERSCEIARDLGMFVIPNLIIGIPGDDYERTTAWLADNVDLVPVVNVNWLAVHHGNTRGTLDLPDNGIADRDQNSSTKSWLDPADEARGHEAIERFQQITDDHWNGRRTNLRALASSGA